MNFFKKRWVAWTLCVCMIFGGLLIGHIKQRQSEYTPPKETSSETWAWKHYAAYERYIKDDANVLSSNDIKELSVYNASSDYTYDTVCGIWILTNTTGKNLQKNAASAVTELELNSRDLILLLDLQNNEWYLGPAGSLSQVHLHDLDILAAESIDPTFRTVSHSLLKLFSNLAAWYEHNLTPINAADHISQVVTTIGKTAGKVLTIAFLIAALILTAIIVLAVKLYQKYRTSKSKNSCNFSHTQMASDRMNNNRKSHYCSSSQSPSQQSDHKEKQ